MSRIRLTTLMAAGLLFASCREDEESSSLSASSSESLYSSTVEQSFAASSGTVFTVTLKTLNSGRFMVAEGAGGGVVNANRNSADTWETFRIIDKNGGSLQNGDLVHIQAFNGQLLQVVNGTSTTLRASSHNPEAWETFRIATAGTVASGSVLGFQSVSSGRYLSAMNGGGGVVTVQGLQYSNWEKFYVNVLGKNAVTSPNSTPNPSPTAKLSIRVQGRQLLVDGKPFTIRGVCYAPVPRGKTISQTLFLNPSASDLQVIERDFQLMKDAGLNTIRPYLPITNSKVLDLLNKYQLFVIQPVFNAHNTSHNDIRNVINTVKNHRSTLMWQVGNEWNYNLLYGAANFGAAKNLVKQAGALIKSVDRSIPLSTNWGEMVDPNLVNELSDFDIWSINVYAGKTFGNRFNDYKNRSSKPMFFGEFGADAFNSHANAPDPHSQGVATDALLKEIKANLSANNPNNAALGGTIFEWNDEWWKDGKGSLDVQDRGGIAPGGGPFPDAVFNEEWWGVVDINRNPRPAYYKLKENWK